MNVLKKQIELVEAVNNAKTEHDHYAAELRLSGFRECLDILGYHGFRIESDLHYLNQGIDRPMCCGVFIDWEPSV